MLRELSIKNFAIIEDLQIRFSRGLTILSGETGAGKSIIINAVNLVLGSRAATSLIRDKARQAELEALFEIPVGSPVARDMADNGYDPAEGLLIRRIISRQDQNRIYINGRLATIGLLGTVTRNLASISGQHAHQRLLKEDQQLLILDQYGGLLGARDRVRAAFEKIQSRIQALNQLKKLNDRQAEQIDLFHFQRKEITAAAVEPGEDQRLEVERSRLKNVEALYSAVHGSIQTLYGEQGAAVERLVEAGKNLETAGRLDAELGRTADNLLEATYGIEDIIEGLRAYLNGLQMDPGRLEAVEERLDILGKLKRKYGGSLEAVLDYLESIDRQLSDIDHIAERIADAEADLDALHAELSDSAAALSNQRRKAAARMAKLVEKQLSGLKMARSRFRVSLERTGADPSTPRWLSVDGNQVHEDGLDRLEFLIAPNVGESLKSLSAIASGGELSRVILALKAILAATDELETVVFDEVDAGIGGEAAERVGKKLMVLARHHQVLCITHLPQLARFGDHHFRISKHVRKGRTVTTIEPLRKEKRVRELARMLAGEKITPKTLAHARELLAAIE